MALTAAAAARARVGGGVRVVVVRVRRGWSGEAMRKKVAGLQISVVVVVVVWVCGCVHGETVVAYLAYSVLLLGVNPKNRSLFPANSEQRPYLPYSAARVSEL